MHVVITGGNRGIGLAFTQLYLAQGHEVTVICRTPSAALQSSGANIIENVDVTSEQDRLEAVAQLNNKTIDVLINNAGILRSESLEQMDEGNIQAQLTTNAIAPVMLTHTFLPLLNKKAKVALITSRMGSIADNGSGGYYGYRMSKAALNAAGKSLALDLEPQGMSVAILHTGFVQTDMVGGAGDITAATAAERLAQRIEELNLSNTGTFWHSNGEVLPW